MSPLHLRCAGEEDVVVCQGRARNAWIQGFAAEKRRGWHRGGILDARKSAVAPYTRPGLGGCLFFQIHERVALGLDIGRGSMVFSSWNCGIERKIHVD